MPDGVKSVSAARAAALTDPLSPMTFGVVVGVLSKVADHFGPVLEDLTSYLGLWVAAGALVGRVAWSLRAAVAWTVLFLLAATAAYYATYWILDGSGPVRIIALWLVTSVTAGPVLGALGHLTGQRTQWGAVSTASLAGLLASEAVLLGIPHIGVGHWLIVLFDACAAAGILLAGPAASRLRLWTFALTPVFVLAGLAVPWLFRHLIVGWVAP